MEQVFVRAKSSFVNQRLGTVTRRQRLPVPAGIARELESLGLVEIEKQSMTVRQDLPRDPLGVGMEAPLSALPAGQVSVTSSSPPRKRGRPRKAGG